jgi:enediyne polyketide synthase
VTEAVAIVGVACRYPDARTPEELWQTVLARRRAFRRLPEERLHLQDYSAAYDADPDAIYPIEAAVLEDYAFDRARFRIPTGAVASADLTHWLALDVATDALANAGLLADGALARDNTAVIVGNTLTGEFSRAGLLRGRWPYVRRQLDAALVDEGFEANRRSSFLQRFEDAYKAPFPPPDEETLAGGLSNTIAGRICNYYDLHGGGYTVDGACASSLLAVAHACRLLESNEVDTVLAGGVDLSLDPFELVGFARNGALSKSVMRVFDRQSDGFWPGEGCGFVVLKRVDAAAAGHHRVRALIRGWGISSDGAGGLTRPTISGQRTALERAYRRAGFGPGSVPLFEAHGTGTAVGDPVEIAAIAEARRSAGIEVPAVVGSIKANIGHTKAAAGLAGLIKAVLALEERVLPAATGCQDIHPQILEQRDAVMVPQESRVWPEAWPLRAGVSAFGFGGINLHLALEGIRRQPRGGFNTLERRLTASEQDAEVFLFAADDHETLRRQIADFAALAPQLSRAELADAAAALAARLNAGNERAMTVAATPSQLAERLGQLLGRRDREFIDPKAGIGAGVAQVSPKIAFLFPGQAAPIRPSSGPWVRRFRWLEANFQAADLPEDFDSIATEIAQPAIMANCQAGLAILAHFGIAATVAVGHSVGELAALHWAGGFDADALLRLAHGRGRAMAELSLPGGAMALISGKPDAIEALLQGADAVIACHNGAQEFVVSGAAEDVTRIVQRASAKGLTAQRLHVSHAFHSRFVAPAEKAVRDLASLETFAPLQRRVISTVTGATLAAETDLGELLGRQVVAPVLFAEALAAASEGIDLFIEVGPGCGMTRIAADRGGAPCVALDTGGDSLVGLLSAVGAAFVLGAPIQVSALFADRFVRDFDLDRPRRFLANPCEAATSANAASRSHAKPEPVSIVPAIGTPGRSALEVMRELLASRLELDVALIEPGHRLLNDLHLNSIAVGQIVVEAARLLGRMPPVVPTNFAVATVAEAASTLEAATLLAGDANEQFPAGVDTWIRCFATQYEERQIPAQTNEAPRNWRVFAPQGRALTEPLSCLLQRDDQPAEGVAVCLSEFPTIEDQRLLLAATRCALAGPAGTMLFALHARGGGAAFARCVSLEHPNLRVLVLELPFKHPDASAWVAAEVACVARGYQRAHYEISGRRLAPMLLPLPDREPAKVSDVLSADDVVLVSGGAKGIGAECALALARRTGAKFALLGRSRADAPAVSTSLARLRAAGIAVSYQSADVTDGTAVAAAVAQLESALGPVTVVLHAAGVNNPCPVARLDDAALADTVTVKVAGLRHLLGAVAPEKLRLLVGFGSIIARIGLPGEAHYALANEWMAQSIEQFAEAHPWCRAFVPEWSVWSGVGMGETLGVVETLAHHGVAALAAEPAARLFASLAIARDTPASVVIASRFGNPPTVDLARPPLPLFRFLERVPVFYPGIELVAETVLSPTTDPYLDQHALVGTKLFPAVLGLEAMFQAAAVLASERPNTLERVTFDRPVATDDGAVSLRIAALRSADGGVELALRSDQTGFQADQSARSRGLTRATLNL